MMIDSPSRISGSAFCTVNNVPRAFREKIVSNCSSLIVPNGKHHIHVAFLACHAVIEAVEIRELRRIASPVMNTKAPSSTNSLADAGAIPEVAPVITATLPSNLPMTTLFLLALH